MHIKNSTLLEKTKNIFLKKNVKQYSKKKEIYKWENSSINSIWSEKEIFGAKNNHLHHLPKNGLDKIIYFTVRLFYHSFNAFTGYCFKDPSPKSVIHRLIILESIAGVPGMIAASIRHVNSLCKLKRDNGWIHTLLEEAENERMHLLIIMKKFDAGLLIRASIIAIQSIFVSALLIAYLLHPPLVHRFVGYLEETAVITYSSVIKKIQIPGSKLHQAWNNLDASDIARSYWNLNSSAKWVDTLKMILSDEAHHRDINHTFAVLQSQETNPFVDFNLKQKNHTLASY